MTAKSFYEKSISGYTSKSEALKKRITLVSVLRLLSFAGFAFAGYKLVTGYGIWLWFAVIILAGVFVWLVRLALQLNDEKALLEKLLFINKNELGILTRQPNQMDDGSSFLTDSDYSHDLDIFGRYSLFHVLNRTTTVDGRLFLAERLHNPMLSKKSIAEVQQAILTLTTQAEERQLITARGLLNEEKETSLRSISQWLKTGNHLHNKPWLKILRWVWPPITVAAFIYYLETDLLGPFIIAATISWLITGVFVKYIHKQHALLSKKQAVLEQYAGILKAFTLADTGSSVKLKELNAIASNSGLSIGQLAKLTSFFDQRINMLVFALLNTFLLYDIQCILALEKWKKKNKPQFENWIDCVAQIEYLNSLAAFAYNNPEFAYAVVTDEEFVIDTVQMAHPLIAANERIANDFSTGKSDKLILLTGSNMSGKTTFLRSAGINLILAQCGAPVCAKSFRFHPMLILSSIRVSDSLQEHTSYFMAELKKLQSIIRMLQTGKVALVLIDEILRGTNSNDKHTGSEQFIKQLLQYKCITLFATHDLQLGRLEEQFPGKISNYCFESIIENGELNFDYKLRKGVAQNKNASFLMKKMGII
jgi:hypothetical protein